MDEENKQKEELSQEEVFNVLKFAQMVSREIPFDNVYTPDLVNNALKYLNINIAKPTNTSLDVALGNPNGHEDDLVAYNEYYNINNMTYKRLTNYLANMLSFDLNITCKNAEKSDYKSKEYKEDLQAVYDFLDRLNYKREFNKIIKNMLRQETVFSSLRTDAQDYAIQQLPSSMCKITGYTPYTKLFDFNMYYFIKPAIDINGYSPIFKQYYYDIFGSMPVEEYRPSNALNNRTGQFSMWHQTSPIDGFWCFKFSPEIFTKVPYLSPMMKDIENSSIIRNLQINKDIISARALIMGEVGFLDLKSGSKQDALNLSPNTLATFLQLVKNGLEESWSAAGLPLDNIQKFQYEDSNPDMYSNQLKTTAGQGVSLSRIIYATDKMSNSEVEQALATDANLMKSLYPQFEDFLYFYANRYTKRYTFEFKFEGIEYPSDRDERLDRALQLADKGIVLKPKICSALGCTPMEFDRMLEETAYSGFTDKLVNLVSIYTTNNDTPTVGGGTNKKSKGSGGGKRGRPKETVSGRLHTQSRDYDDTNADKE